MPIITLSRQMCSYGEDIALALSRKLGWEIVERNDLLYRFPAIGVSEYDLKMLAESARYYLKPTVNGDTFLDRINLELHKYLENKPAILLGFGSQLIFSDRKDALHVRIIAPKEVRLQRAKKQFHVSDDEGSQILQTADRKHKKFVSTVFNADLDDPSLYHLILNTASLSVDECVSAIEATNTERQLALRIEKETENTKIKNNLTERPELKNQSEAEFAKILDLYQIEWKYEPKTFPIEWDAEGNVTTAFSPDFYLPQFDTYIELTTMDQKYVTKKNKKARRVQELYPGTNVKIVYKKEFHALIERFNQLRGENK